MLQPGSLITGYEYESPEAQTLGTVPAHLKERTLSVAKAMVAEACPHLTTVFLKVPFENGRANIEDPRFQDWAEAVADELPEAPEGGELQQVDLRVVKSAYHMNATRRLHSDLPFYNVHTDFRARLAGDSFRYYLSQFARRAFVLEGPGSQILEGEISVPEAMQFRSFILETDFDPERAMSFFRMPLVGEDAQLLRGPAVSDPLCFMKGNYEVRDMPEGEWFDIPSASVHRTPPDVNDGRMIATIHYFPKANSA